MAIRTFSDERPKGFQTMGSDDVKHVAENRYPYLHAVGAFDEEVKAKMDNDQWDKKDLAQWINLGKCGYPSILYGDMGWFFQYWHPEGDYPPALVATSGARGFGKVDFDFVDSDLQPIFWDGEDEHLDAYRDINDTFGSRNRQMLASAVEFVLLAKRLNWQLLHITSGQDSLKRYVAVVGKIFEYEVTGHELGSEDDHLVDAITPFVMSVKEGIEKKKQDAIARCLSSFDVVE
jgi:hypothetical protein